MSGRVVWLARHGHRMDEVDSAWKTYARRPVDPDLSPKGMLQAMKLAKRMKREPEPINHLVVSPFLRTMRTASFVAAELGLPMKVEYGIGEMRSEEYFPDGDTVFPALAARREYFPWIDMSYTSLVMPRFPETNEGENSALRRTTRVMKALLDTLPGNLILVSHYAICNGGTHYFSGALLEGYLENCTICKFIQQDDGSWKTAVLIEHTHLFEPLPHEG